MAQKYLGITPYDEDSSFEFAGRNEETWALYDRIIRNEYTVYYAASGEGKSSLIRAGLLPILRRRDFFPVYIVFEDRELENLSAIESVIDSRIKVEEEKYKVTYEQSFWSKSRFDRAVSEQLKNNIWWRLRNYCFKRGDTELRPLFIFDQFEEVFTKANYDWTNQFFSWLEKISIDYIPDSLREIVNSHGIDMPTQKNYKALFSFRTEYLGDLDYWCVQKHFIPSLQENRMCLKPLTPKGAKEIISLNESSLGKYALKITQGCAEVNANINNEDQPCVYALILSVVCQTLSDITDKERESLLENLNNQQDDTIDNILLKFYKKKLHAAGLDYVKDEKIIAEIENALVDEKGKRSRRDTDDASMRPLAKWINLLSDKSNGLIKIIGKKEAYGQIVNTVEFPHDRFCKAIDSSRKERQGKISWRLNRQTEWMQFGFISAVVGIIAFLWNALMPSIKPVISNALSKKGYIDVMNLFFQNYIGKNGHPSEYVGYSLDEGFSTLFLMVALVLFVPLMTISIVRKGKKWQLTTSIISVISLLSFAFLWYKNNNIFFANSYVPIFTFIGATFSLACLCMSTLRLRLSYTKGESKDLNKSNYSNWPLWGGYIIFASYLFYEFLFRTTFGINEPSDSSWALLVLPLFYSFFAWGFFNMSFSENDKKRILFIYVVSVFLLLLVDVISFVPYYNNFKQSYGFAISIILILLWLSTSTYIMCKAKSNSKYYILSKLKRLLATGTGTILIIATFILNLGYNPIAINPNTVCFVHAWRDVIVHHEDSTVSNLSVLYSTDGDTIIPFCISKDIEETLAKGKYPYFGGNVPIKSKLTSSPFTNDTIYKNIDNSLFWNPYDSTVTAYIRILPTLEKYLHTIRRKGVSNHNNLKESIDYYAASLFDEIRKANILYASEGIVYTFNSLKSFSILDSLQHISLGIELNKLYSLDDKDSLSFDAMEIVNRSGRLDTVPRYTVLQDKHLIDFHRELSRSFLLCLIKDRASQSDMPSMFNLANIYLIAYFTSVPSMNIHLGLKVTQNFTINIKDQDKTTSKIATKNINYDIYSDDILNKRFFAWNDLFNCLCIMDMGWNSKTYENASNFEKLYEEMSKLHDIQKEILPVLMTVTTSPKDIMKNGKNAADSLSHITSYLNDFLKSIDSMYYKYYLDRLEKITPSLNFIAVDQSLKQLRDDVFSTLLPIMNSRTEGIYNNDFENICVKLNLVAAFRGNDIENNSKDLSEYLSEKNKIYDYVNQINRIRADSKHLLKQKRELEELLRKIIKALNSV